MWFEACAEVAQLWQFSMVIHLENRSYLEAQGFTHFCGHEKWLCFWWWCDSRAWQCLTTHGTADSELASNVHWQIFVCPFYSLTLVSSDFHLFSDLKDHFLLHNFTSSEDIKCATFAWLTQQGHGFCASRMDRLIAHYDNCHSRPGDCTSGIFTVYCQFPLLKSCFWFMGTVNLLPDQPS